MNGNPETSGPTTPAVNQEPQKKKKKFVLLITRPTEGKVRGVLLDTPSGLTDAQIHNIVSKQYTLTEKEGCRRMIIRGQPSELTSLKFATSEELQRAIAEGLKIEHGGYGRMCNIEESRRKKAQLIRCYNCQKFGSHVARLCQDTRACVSCGEDHEDCQTTSIKCANCKGVHKADSTDCSAFKTYKDKVESSASKWT